MAQGAQTSDTPDLIRPAEAARRFGVSTRTLARWEDAGHLPAVKTLSGQRRYRTTDIDALITANAS